MNKRKKSYDQKTLVATRSVRSRSQISTKENIASIPIYNHFDTYRMPAKNEKKKERDKKTSELITTDSFFFG